MTVGDSTRRAAALREARRWIGTPYLHQASTLGAGCDCLGLIRGVWRALYGQEPSKVPPYSRDWSEALGDERLWRAARRHLRPVTQALPGDVLLFRMRAGTVAKHLGIQAAVGAAPSFIHAYGHHAVMESPLTAPWQRRIVARFAFPEALPTSTTP
ncbi:NlpC/P60 family protein [Cognatishimia sp. SS12]|uniref:NlpC/P60 family protein n=1 Tax=Cognatishimia sp. SS12 TaxID=2979465 RepID=UPI00232CC5D3|nr:NlpC/P60 family protein [Cognatishimia sp. SS12]MDC0737524.1 NlpC/P60 family protein [Cognatishimia sp. SS12]